MSYIYNQALGGITYHGEKYIRPYYGLEYPLTRQIQTRQIKIINLFRRTFDFLFTKTIRPWSIDKPASQNAIQHEI